MRKALKVASTILVATVAFALTATPAYAGSYFMTTRDNGSPGGSVKFTASGDHVHLCDIQGDSAHVELQVVNVTKDPNQFEYQIRASGVTDCTDVNAAMKQPYNLAEKHCFHFRMWLVNDGQMVRPSEVNGYWRNYNNDKSLCPGVD